MPQCQMAPLSRVENKLFLNQPEAHVVWEGMMRFAKQETQGLTHEYRAHKVCGHVAQRALAQSVCVCHIGRPSSDATSLTHLSEYRMCVCASCEARKMRSGLTVTCQKDHKA